MNQEKEMTQIVVNSSVEYLAPSVKVVKMRARLVICDSGKGQLSEVGKETGEW